MSDEKELKLPPYVPIFLGLRESLCRMQVSPADLGVLLSLHLACTFKTGVYQGCAQSLAGDFGSQAYVKVVQKSLQRLRDKFGFINYPKGVGSLGSYPILINKYIIRDGPLKWFRLDAFGTTNFNEQMYENLVVKATGYGRSSDGGETVRRRIVDAHQGGDGDETETRRIRGGGEAVRWTEERPIQEYIEGFKKLRVSRGFKSLNLISAPSREFDDTPDNIPSAARDLPDNLYLAEGDPTPDQSTPASDVTAEPEYDIPEL